MNFGKGRARSPQYILYPEGGPSIPYWKKSTKSNCYDRMSFTRNWICLILLHVLWGKYIQYLNKTNKKRLFSLFFLRNLSSNSILGLWIGYSMGINEP